MKTFAALLASVMLAACGSTQRAAPAPAAPAVAETPAPNAAARRLTQMLTAAGGERAPSQADVEQAFGEADLARREGAGAALTYRYESCALLLLFSADRLTQAHASARRQGEAAPSLESCAEEAARRG